MKQFGSRTMALLLLAGILLGANLAQLMFRQRFYQGEEKNGGGVKGGGEWQDQDDQWDIWSKEAREKRTLPFFVVPLPERNKNILCSMICGRYKQEEKIFI